MQNLIISNNVILTGQQNLSGTLSFGSSNVKLTTGDSLTLKSTLAGTARVADITTANGSLLTGNEISGLITVERFISAKRAWRLLSTPITPLNAPTINTAWQEGQGGNSTSTSNSIPCGCRRFASRSGRPARRSSGSAAAVDSTSCSTRSRPHSPPQSCSLTMNARPSFSL